MKKEIMIFFITVLNFSAVFGQDWQTDFSKAKEIANQKDQAIVDEFYTSDYDLSEFLANQFGFGISYTDIFTKFRIRKWGLKSVDLKFYQYDRNSTFSSSIFTLGVKFIKD